MRYNMADDSLYVRIGEQIMLARRRAGLSQRDLGQRLGISHAAVSDVERGKTRPDLGNLAAIAGALNIPLSDLVMVEDRNRAAQRPPAEG